MTNLRAVVPALLMLAACSSSIEDAQAVDGDTFKVADQRYRLVGIDAPEMPGHCRPNRQCVEGDPFTSRLTLQSFLDEGVRCTEHGRDAYDRTLVICTTASGSDLAGVLVNMGMAEVYQPRRRP